MPKIIQDARGFRADRAWGARDIAEIEGATVRLHWTDQRYKWHVNDGAEAFLVLDGVVEMRYREGDGEHRVLLKEGDIFVAETGDAHVAHPIGEARVLVVEAKGSV
ncbi:cupin domain-containing protein [Sphingomonas soli]|uniref:cupin domain-containing protein n=1 Tax=Sphingomonas soli TaxID=266127 RepID=UPI00082D49A0|nr:cupin domain-containing protein [Sphingomonas soli]